MPWASHFPKVKWNIGVYSLDAKSCDYPVTTHDFVTAIPKSITLAEALKTLHTIRFQILQNFQHFSLCFFLRSLHLPWPLTCGLSMGPWWNTFAFELVSLLLHLWMDKNGDQWDTYMNWLTGNKKFVDHQSYILFVDFPEIP